MKNITRDIYYVVYPSFLGKKKNEGKSYYSLLEKRTWKKMNH